MLIKSTTVFELFSRINTIVVIQKIKNIKTEMNFVESKLNKNDVNDLYSPTFF